MLKLYNIYRPRSHEPTNRSLLRALYILTSLTDSSVRVTADDMLSVWFAKVSLKAFLTCKCKLQIQLVIEILTRDYMTKQRVYHFPQ